MAVNKKPFFPAERLINNWPFSAIVAEHIFQKNLYNSYSSLRSFLINTAFIDDSMNLDDLDVEDFSFQDYLVDSTFILQDNTVYCIGSSNVYYDDSIKAINPKSGEPMFFVKYSLDNISYENIVCEAIRFHMKSFFNNPDPGITYLRGMGLNVTQYLLYTRYSHFVKNVIEEEKYMERFKKLFIKHFYFEVKGIESTNKGRFLSEKKVNPRERLLNVLSLTSLSKDQSETVVDNFLSTGDLKEILSYYQEIETIE